MCTQWWVAAIRTKPSSAYSPIVLRLFDLIVHRHGSQDSIIDCRNAVAQSILLWRPCRVQREPVWYLPCGGVSQYAVDGGVRILHKLVPPFRYLKPRPHQQQCRSNVVECYTSRAILSTKSKQIEHVQFVSTLSKRWNLATGSNVVSTKSNVASTLLQVWMGLNAVFTVRLLTRNPSLKVAPTMLAQRTGPTQNTCRCYLFTVSNSGLVFSRLRLCLDSLCACI